MAGAIIENMSTKKLVIVGVILLLFQAFSFMVGGLIGKFSYSPSYLPTSNQRIRGVILSLSSGVANIHFALAPVEILTWTAGRSRSTKFVGLASYSLHSTASGVI